MATNLTQRGANANRAALLPALPDSQNVVDPAVRSQLELIREVLEVRLGSRGDRWERAVTFRDLEPLLAEFDRRLKVLEAASGVATPDNDRRLRALAARVDQMAIQNEIDYTENIGAITRITTRVRDVAVEDVWVFAHAMRPTATGGCSAFTVVEFGTDQPNFHCLLFGTTVDESADFSAMLPFSWAGRMFRVYVYWGHGAGGTDFDTRWEVQANSTGDNEALVLTFDTGSIVEDTGGTAGNLYIGAVSDPVPVTRNLNRGGDIVNLRITRRKTHANDTLDIDAALLAVRFTLADVPFPDVVPADVTFVWNSADKHADVTLSNSDLTCTASAIWRMVRGDLGKSSGKWYFEVTFDSVATWSTVGVAKAASSLTLFVGCDASGYGIGPDHTYTNGGSTSHGNSIHAGEVAGVAIDIDAGTIWFSSNNVWVTSGSPADPATATNPRYTGLSAGTYYPACAPGLQTMTINDVLTYTPPSGFSPWA